MYRRSFPGPMYRRHQELRVVDDRSRGPRRRRRFSLGRSGIPVSVTGFAEGEVSKPSDKYVGGKSTQGVGFYSGPCTPPNTMPHHYTFVLVATDFDPQELPPGLTHDEVVQKLAPNGGRPVHAKGLAAGLVGLFVNPWKN